MRWKHWAYRFMAEYWAWRYMSRVARERFCNWLDHA